MQDFRNLIVWQKSHSLTIEVYKITNEFPKSELFGLTSQIRRSVSSIPTNIAEGCGRGSDKDFARFIQIALGSASETEYQLLLSNELGYITNTYFECLLSAIQEVKKMLTILLKTLKINSK
jgi:four helix bundle protein